MVHVSSTSDADAIGKVLLVGGNPSNDVSVPYASDAIIWDLRSLSSSPSNNSSNCPAVADYPLALVQGTGAFVYEVCSNSVSSSVMPKIAHGHSRTAKKKHGSFSVNSHLP